MSISKPAEIFIRVTDDHIDAALCYDGELWQIVREMVQDQDPFAVGTIYRTKVIKRLSPQHAICDLKDRSGFLEAFAKYAPEGAWLMAQIRREAWADKDPTLTAGIYLRNRYLVYQPDTGDIEVPTNREKHFANVIDGLKKISWSGQIKSQAKNIDVAFLLQTAGAQQQEWRDLQASFQGATDVTMLGKPITEMDRFFQTVDQVGKIYIDQSIYYKDLEADFSTLMPDLKDKLELYKKGPIFSEHDILDQWHNACESVITLPSGVRLRFDITPTLTAIDVDSSGGLGDAVEINTSVVGTLARLIALKNIGGIIVIDFLKMKQTSDRLAIQQKLELAMVQDPFSPRVLGFTKAGLCEITRLRRGPSLPTPTESQIL